MRRFALALAALLAPVSGLAAAAEPPCLSPGEFGALSTYSLPSLISGTTQRCAASLPADAWLRANGGGLADRYASLRPRAWPVLLRSMAFLSVASIYFIGMTALKTRRRLD